jgi:hypothetical protein
MKKQKELITKTLSEIIDLTNEPNILEDMVDNNFKDYKIKKIKEQADPDAIVLDGLDSAIIGLSYDRRLVYDIDVMRKIFVERDGMEVSEVDEFLSYNVFGGHFGELNPIYVSLNMELVLLTLK